MKKLLIVCLLLSGCGRDFSYSAKKITQGERSWYACSIIYSFGRVQFHDQSGNSIILYGNVLIEDTRDYVCEDDFPVKADKAEGVK